MVLIRFAVIVLSRPAPARLGRWTYPAQNGETVSVVALPKVEQDVTEEEEAPDHLGGPTMVFAQSRHKAVLLVEVHTAAGVPTIDDAGLVSLPEEARRRAEQAIVEYADLLGVVYQCKRSILSPDPCVAVYSADPDDARRLDESSGLQTPIVTRPRTIVLPELRPDSPYRDLLRDRLDGLALLADSLAEDGAVGRVHDLFRLFERAFARGPSGCAPPLTQFLSTASRPLRYSEAEVTDWFQRLRPIVTHADRREEYARGPDVEPHLARIELAAYDVLFNKATWRNPAADRRAGMELTGGIDPDGTVVLFRQDGTIVLTWLDPFGVFEIDKGATITVSPPAIWRMPGVSGDSPGASWTFAQFRMATDDE